MHGDGIEGFYPLGPLQQGLLFHSLLAPGTAAYVEQFRCRFTTPLDPATFEAAWAHMVRRHPVLRTFFVWEGLPTPVQVVQQEVAVPLEYEDWRDVPAAEREARLETLVRAEGERDFALGRAPLMRLRLVRLDEQTHAFVWTFHHALMDGWSIFLLLAEMCETYETLTKGRSVPQSAPRPYRDYVAWVAQQDLATAEAFWRQALRGFTEPTPLVVDREAARAGTAGDSVCDTREIRLAAESTEALYAVARRHRVTLSTVAQAAWGLLLSRYGGVEDVVFGTTVAGRPAALEGVDSMVGLFINTLPVRVRVEPDAPVGAWLRRVQAQLAELRHYEYSPLAEVQRWSEVGGGAPLFESLFLFENYRKDASLEEMGRALGLADVQWGERTNYPLAMFAIPEPAGMLLHAVYHRARFEAEAVERLLGHFATLLEAMTRAPDARVADLPFLTEQERHRVLREWNATSADYPRDACVVDLVKAQAARTPDAMAVEGVAGALTYGELDRRTGRLAARLRGLGVEAESLVGIHLERGVDLVVAVLAVWKAGGAYVPLDPEYPPERLAFMMEDAAVGVVITQETLRGQLPNRGAKVVLLHTDEEQDGEEGWPPDRSQPEHLAYVIYTSGSTGRPKGVQVPHRTVVNCLWSMAREPGLTSADVLLAVTTLSFDIAVLELFLPLIVGARLVVAGADEARDGRRLAARLAAAGATAMQATPTTWRLLCAAGWPGSPSFTALCGGEAMPRDLVPPLLGRVGSLWNVYGPTETTIWSTCHRVGPTDGSIPIGHPIANTQVYVLDAGMRPVPVGAGGEIYIGGDGVTRGYLNRPELTAERFVPDPFAAEAGRRLYRTGDRGRWRSDGTLEYLGRMDLQVKVRGFRIELGEIEAVMHEHSGVREAAVAVRADRGGTARLVGYVVASAEASPDREALRAHLRQRLPEYMVPAAFVMLDALPLTPNSKIDRRALPEPDQGRPEAGRAAGAPRDALETELVAIWQEVTGVTPIGVTDDFFDLGGHSLLALRLVAEIEARLGKRLHVSTVFHGRTIGRIADVLRWQRGDSLLSSVVAIQPAGSRRPLYVGGNHPRYVDLAQYLEADQQPFYGLDAYTLQGERLARGEPVLRTVEALAAYFLREIRARQPEGPYYVAGACEGGIIAFEMAQQLRRQGEEVGLLLIWETGAPRYWLGALRRLAFQLRALLEGRSRLPLRWRTLRAMLRHEYVEHSIFQAVARYRPLRYPGRLTLIRAVEDLYVVGDPKLGWEELVSEGVELHTVPGSHLTYLQEHWRELAERLRSSLADAQRRAGAGRGEHGLA